MKYLFTLRYFILTVLLTAVVLGLAAQEKTKQKQSRQIVDKKLTEVLLRELPGAPHLSQAVLFGFDKSAFPFQDGVQTQLIQGQSPHMVLFPGELGSPDEFIGFYGSVIRIGDTFHAWYNGNYGPFANTTNHERENWVICYATSKDGIHWEKPDLGLVEFNGSKHNNIVAGIGQDLWSTAAVLYDKEELNPQRRYKMAYEGRTPNHMQFKVAFSADGLHWVPSPRNPMGFFLEAAGVMKFRGLYYVCGQGKWKNAKGGYARKLTTIVSVDFEHWSPIGSIGYERPKPEEVHLGAGLWNRGNVVIGLCGLWHGSPSGNRAWVGIDLGLVISHDGLQYNEPVPDYRLVPAGEQDKAPLGFAPALMQGQGMENVGDQTLFWYGLWRGTALGGGSGIRLVTWQRDRLGMLKPFRPKSVQTISCTIQSISDITPVFVNADGLGANSQLRVNLLDQGFQPIPGYSGDDAAVISTNGLKTPVHWKGGAGISSSMGEVRIQVQFEGVRPEDASLYAIYLGDAGKSDN